MSDTLASHYAHSYIDTVTFRVGDSLFKVPRGPFESESPAFQDVFLLPTDSGDCANAVGGETNDSPVHLDGIKKEDFELFLSILFHRTDSADQVPLPETNDQWKSVFRLASLWRFDAIRQLAMNHLQSQMSAVDRIILGEDYKLDFESWTLPAMHEIVRRHEPISVEEGERLGLEMALSLASVREHVSTEGRRAAPGPRPTAKALDFSHILRATFKQAPSHQLIE